MIFVGCGSGRLIMVFVSILFGEGLMLVCSSFERLVVGSCCYWLLICIVV